MSVESVRLKNLDQISKQALNINASINWLAASIRHVIPSVQDQATLPQNSTVYFSVERIGYIHSSLDQILKMQEELQAAQIWMSTQMLLMQRQHLIHQIRQPIHLAGAC